MQIGAAPCRQTSILPAHGNQWHIDQGKYATFSRYLHICQHYRKTFGSEMLCIGIIPGASVEPTAVANTVLVEP